MRKLFVILVLCVAVWGHADDVFVEGVQGYWFVERTEMEQRLLVIAMAHAAHHANIVFGGEDSELALLTAVDLEWIRARMITYIEAKPTRRYEQLFTLFALTHQLWVAEVLW